MRPLGITAVAASLLGALCGCRADQFTPKLRPAPRDLEAFERQFDHNRQLPPERCRRVTVIVMLPSYGVVEQIRRGNMGHAAIDVDGRLYDIGALNGYAYTFRAAPAVRFWSFANADAALEAVAGHPDCDGHLDRIVRFDVTVTDEQAARLHEWWGQFERRMSDDPDNGLYLWSDWQCASAVSRSLRDAGVTWRAVQSPSDVEKHLTRKLRHTAGPCAGERVEPIVVQSGRRPRAEPGALSQFGTVVFHFPKLFAAGERSALKLRAPDGTEATLLWSGSPEFARHVAALRITPAEAVARAMGPGPAWGAQATPNFIIGSWYHIATDHVIGQAAVGGPYVHGETGEVITSDDDRVIRFDLFGGDRVVVPRDQQPVVVTLRYCEGSSYE